jgi:N-glycosylase/DNA lyase
MGKSIQLTALFLLKEQLLRLPGIGPKVADCICLMALDMHHVVPVDRHIYNLTLQIYKPNFLLAGKRTTSTGAMTISKQIHRQIGEHRAIFHL